MEPTALILQPTYFEGKEHDNACSLAVEFCDVTRLYLEGKLEESYDRLMKLIHTCEDDSYMVMLLQLKYGIEMDLGYKSKVEETQLLVRELIRSKDKYDIERRMLTYSGISYLIMSLDEKSYNDLVPILSLFSIRNLVKELIQNDGIKSCENILEQTCRELDKYDCPAIIGYSNIVLAVYYNLIANEEMRKFHLNKALRVLLPRKWYTPIAEYSLTLDLGFIKEMNQDAYKAIKSLSNRIVSGYRNLGFFTEVIDDNNDDYVTKLQIAYMIAMGNTNKEISEELRLSEYMLKQKISDIYASTGISSRKELKEVVMKNIIL